MSTTPVGPTLTHAERVSLLTQHISLMYQQGYRVIHHIDPHTADLQPMSAPPKHPNPLLHIMLSIFTCGAWLFVWATMMLIWSVNHRAWRAQPLTGVPIRLHITETGQPVNQTWSPA